MIPVTHAVVASRYFPGQPAQGQTVYYNKGLVAGYSAVIRPNLMSNFRYGFVRESFGTIGNSYQPWITFNFTQSITSTQKLVADEKLNEVQAKKKEEGSPPIAACVAPMCADSLPPRRLATMLRRRAPASASCPSRCCSSGFWQMLILAVAGHVHERVPCRIAWTDLDIGNMLAVDRDRLVAADDKSRRIEIGRRPLEQSWRRRNGRLEVDQQQRGRGHRGLARRRAPRRCSPRRTCRAARHLPRRFREALPTVRASSRRPPALRVGIRGAIRRGWKPRASNRTRYSPAASAARPA